MFRPSHVVIENGEDHQRRHNHLLSTLQHFSKSQQPKPTTTTKSSGTRLGEFGASGGDRMDKLAANATPSASPPSCIPQPQIDTSPPTHRHASLKKKKNRNLRKALGNGENDEEIFINPSETRFLITQQRLNSQRNQVSETAEDVGGIMYPKAAEEARVVKAVDFFPLHRYMCGKKAFVGQEEDVSEQLQAQEGLNDNLERLLEVPKNEKQHMVSLLTQIPEFNLGIEARLRNIEATERARRKLLDTSQLLSTNKAATTGLRDFPDEEEDQVNGATVFWRKYKIVSRKKGLSNDDLTVSQFKRRLKR